MENPFTIKHLKIQCPNPQNLGGRRETWRRRQLFPNPVCVSRGVQRAWDTFCIECCNNLLIDTIINKRYRGIVLICKVECQGH